MSKGPNAFRTISEAAEEVGVPQHVLRFWETKFTFISPMKRAGGRRFYRPNDVTVLLGVRRLLHDQGLTIKGVQRLYREQGLKAVAGFSQADVAFTPAPETREGQTPSSRAIDPVRLRRVLDEVESARSRLDRVLKR